MRIKPLGITCIYNTGVNLIDRNNMEKTLRDEIAIAAMQAIFSNNEVFEKIAARKNDSIAPVTKLAQFVYKVADRMLEARKEKDNA